MKLKVTLLVAFAMMACASSSFATSVGLNFVGGRSGAGGNGTGGTNGNVLLASDSAGVVAQTNWNNGFGSNNAGPVALIDNDGAATGATASWSGVPNSWTVSGSAAADANARLMNGYLDTNTSSTTTIEITDVPYHVYNVIVYFDGDGTNRSGNYSVNGTGQDPATLTDVANWPIAAGGGVFDDATFDGVGNFAVFSKQDLSTLTITATVPPDGVFRAPINAIQIVLIPEPATVALLGMAGLGLIRRRRSA